MNKKKKIDQRLFMLFALVILFCSVRAGMIAKAAEQTFDIDAEVLPSGKNTYDIRLTIENQGADWEGIVRLRGNGSYGEQRGCVYDTVLSLPAGSTKQFVVKVPKDSVSSTSGIVKVTLLDKESNVTAQREFNRLLQDEADALYMGILSDTYSSLTYLDMGGNEFYYGNSYLPIKLSELNQGNLIASLDTLHFLIIDGYDTSVLSDETMENIWQWVSDGGMLIVGTGSSAEDVLSGLDKLDIECLIVYEPEEYGYDSNTYVDRSQLHMAELIDKNDMYNNGYGVLSLVSSWGDGSVEILPYALSELGKLDSSLYQDYISQEYFVECILDNANRFSYSQYNSINPYSNDNRYALRRMFYLFGNGSNRLHFGGLKWLVVLYVIFVGPILYLILRFTKKRDFYWIAVPISAFVGILLIYWTGRGFEVGNTNVYSVTIEDLSEKGSAVTYLRCYDAGYKEWDLRLSEGYEYIGPWGDSYYGDGDDSKYYHHIKKEGDRIFFGMNPNTGFDDGYFLAGVTKEPEGGISGDSIKSGKKNISGTVSNETGKDFKYFAVIVNKTLYIYKNLPAGETVNLETAQVVYNETNSYYNTYNTVADTYLYEYMRDSQLEKGKSDTDILAALGMGISYVYTREDANTTVIIGVTEDWDNVVDDNCSEVSYGCLYAIQ